MVAAREVTALRSTGTPSGSGHNSPTAAMILANASSSRESLAEMVMTHARLFRQGSMNLPKPEDSGVPATHPDMCILRIRRQHLLEVRESTVSKAGVRGAEVDWSDIQSLKLCNCSCPSS